MNKKIIKTAVAVVATITFRVIGNKVIDRVSNEMSKKIMK